MSIVASQAGQPFTMGPAILFCPGDRPERFAKAAERADAVIIDLEDAVAEGDKDQAREALKGCDLDPTRTIVRVNAICSDHFMTDRGALEVTGFRYIMVAKAERAQDLAALDGFSLIALCETPLGIMNAAELAACPSVVALMWGAEDLVAAMGGSSSRHDNGSYRDFPRFARNQVALAAAAHGCAMIDAVHMNIPDLDGLRAEAEDAAALGFIGSALIHPSQVETVRQAYAPSTHNVEWATRLLAAAADQPGVFQFDGRMIDEPVLRHARTIVARSQ